MDDKLIQSHSLKQIIDILYPDNLNAKSLSTVMCSLKKRRKVSLKEIADLILFVADTSHRKWNIELILTSINESLEISNWRGVFELFLETDLKVWNTEYLYTIVDSWVHISGIITVPYEIFFRKWNNRENQIEFLRILLESDQKRTQVYSNIFFEKIVTKDDLLNNKYRQGIEYESNFNAVELFKCLKDIDGIEIIDYIKEKSPEYCMLGLAAVQPFHEDVFDDLVVQFSAGVTSQFVYCILFARYRSSILQSFSRMTEKISLTRILDILLEHKMLPVITEVPEPVDLCFDIIILSSRRDHLNFEIWFSNNISKYSTQFVRYLGNKLLVNADKEINTDSGTLIKVNALKTDSEIFPFNKSIVNTVLRIVEANAKELKEESLNTIREIKSKLIDVKSLDKPMHPDRATEFLAEIMSSRMDIEDSIAKIKELVKSDENAINFAKRIFALLIVNYSNLYKIQNSDTIAIFFGELIKRKIIFRPVLKVALQQIKNSLKYPENDREFAFAFRILEIFFAELPEFFFEIDDIESVRFGLIKKELIIVDEESQREVELEVLLDAAFETGDDISTSKDFIHRGIEQAIENMKISSSCSTNFYISFDDNILSNNGTTTAGQVCRYIYTHLNISRQQGYFNYCSLQNKAFRNLVIRKGFEIIKLFFTYRIKNELEYCLILGSFLGSLLIAQNKPVVLDLFDFKSYILKGIEYRRISLTINFVTGFCKEGRKSIIFVPQNPWLMGIFDLLAELHSCTLAHVRQRISELFEFFDLKLVSMPSKRMKTHLVKYTIEYEDVLREVIALALDFSIREICNKIVKSCFTVAKTTASVLFPRLHGENRFFLFKNLLINLTRSLIRISAQEPLKASMCGNITHFLKLAMNELPLEEVYSIVNSNMFICCTVIEKAGITQANESVSALYSSLIANEAPVQRKQGLDPKNALKILAESCFVESTNIRSIESIEYQDIRNFLISIGRKMPAKKKDFITEEWPSLLGTGRTASFHRLMDTVVSSADKDEMCLSLCKYLVGHALKKDCADEFVFEFIRAIFGVSQRCKREVVGWLIYSNDPKKLNLKLFKKFVEYDFVCLEELDQAFKRLLETEDYKVLNFVLDLLEMLLLQDVKYCTVYDFIYTTETLNKMSENARVAEYFGNVQAGMMKFHELTDEFSTFDDFLRNFRYDASPDQFLSVFKEKYKMTALNLPAVLKTCWHHFVLFSGSFRYFKLDVLAALIKEDLYVHLKDSFRFLVQAYQKSHYLFFTFYCRFFVKVLDHVEETIENRILIWKMLEMLSPSSLPSFVTQYIEIMDHRFCIKYLDRHEGFFIAKELLQVISYNKKLVPLVTEFFIKNIEHMKAYSIYLSFLCPEEFVDIKNLFNQTRPKSFDKSINSFFNTFYCLTRHIKPLCEYNELIDHLSECNQISQYAIENIKGLLDKKTTVKEIVTMLIARSEAKNTPQALRNCLEELLKRNEIKEIYEEYERKYFNKP